MARKDKRRSENSPDVRLMQETWKTVWMQGEGEGGLELDCGTVEEARRLRSKLYNATANARRFPDDYPELSQAIAEVELVLDNARPGILVIRKKMLSPMMKSLRGVLEARGVVVEEQTLKQSPRKAEEAAMFARLAGVASTLEEPEPVAVLSPLDIPPPAKKRGNPFY